ncbi:MAG: NAD(P)H-hydrate dehydratase, partial [Methyloprofundus sp.]|nr:NAD(P)H-hydrate dehydratase [Methyloprofundus sp.]
GVQLVSLVAEGKLTADAALAKQAFVNAGGVRLKDYQLIDNSADIVVDGIFGTGLDRTVSGTFATAIAHINQLSVPVFAIDIPSGLHADTGNIMGCAINATMTITFIVLKKGLFTGLAADYCGLLLFSDLAVPQSIIQSVSSQESLLSLPMLAKRKASAHKGSFGHVLVVGGDYGYAGAVHLAAAAALNTGAGLVSVATRREHALQVHLFRPELMGHALEQLSDISSLCDKATALVFGPGLAQQQWAQSIWPTLVALDLPRVIDADALNLLAKEPSYSENWILTPHPGEAARLLHCSTADILQDRFKAVRAIQQQYGGVCVLKGAGSLVCAGSEVYINTTGNPGMASGGMGDVLSGIIGSLLAQKYSLIEAAKTGVYLHGLAADKAAVSRGERGLCASDVLQYLQEVVN